MKFKCKDIIEINPNNRNIGDIINNYRKVGVGYRKELFLDSIVKNVFLYPDNLSNILDEESFYLFDIQIYLGMLSFFQKKRAIFFVDDLNPNLPDVSENFFLIKKINLHKEYKRILDSCSQDDKYLRAHIALIEEICQNEPAFINAKSRLDKKQAFLEEVNQEIESIDFTNGDNIAVEFDSFGGQSICAFNHNGSGIKCSLDKPEYALIEIEEYEQRGRQDQFISNMFEFTFVEMIRKHFWKSTYATETCEKIKLFAGNEKSRDIPSEAVVKDYIQAMSPEQKLEAIFECVKFCQKNQHFANTLKPYGVKLAGCDDGSFTKYFMTKEEALLEARYMKYMESINFIDDLLERDYFFTN